MSCLHYRDHELYIEEVSLTKLAQEFGTPSYVYSRAKIEQNWRAFDAAFGSLSHRICYAVKANSNIGILNVLAKLGSGFDIVSGGELERVLAAGGQASQIVFSGVGKSSDEIRLAIEKNIGCIDVESEAEIERIQSVAVSLDKTAAIALRVNPDVDPRTHPHISTGLKENKFGIDIEKVIPLCQRIQQTPHLQLAGLACHIGSQITELEPFEIAIDSIIQLYHDLAKMNIHLKHINIGGGLGINYRDDDPPTIENYMAIVRNKFAGIPVQIIIEPGRAIIGNAGVLLSRIEYLKPTHHKNFAIIDAGMNDLLRPALYEAWQNILPVMKRKGDTACYDIAGPVCESADFLGKDRELCIEPGDLLAIDTAGAYGFSMSSNYNSRGRAAEILVNGHQYQVIRQRETFQDLIRLERVTTE